jgi:hypothetical protein
MTSRQNNKNARHKGNQGSNNLELSISDLMKPASAAAGKPMEDVSSYTATTVDVEESMTNFSSSMDFSNTTYNTNNTSNNMGMGMGMNSMSGGGGPLVRRMMMQDDSNTSHLADFSDMGHSQRRAAESSVHDLKDVFSDNFRLRRRGTATTAGMSDNSAATAGSSSSSSGTSNRKNPPSLQEGLERHVQNHSRRHYEQGKGVSDDSVFQDSFCSLSSSAARVGSPVLEGDDESSSGSSDQCLDDLLVFETVVFHPDGKNKKTKPTPTTASHRRASNQSSQSGSTSSGGMMSDTSSKYATALTVWAETGARAMADSSATNSARMSDMSGRDRAVMSDSSSKSRNSNRRFDSATKPPPLSASSRRRRGSAQQRPHSSSNPMTPRGTRVASSSSRRAHPARLEVHEESIPELDMDWADASIDLENELLAPLPRRTKSHEVSRPSYTSSSAARPRRSKSHDERPFYPYHHDRRRRRRHSDFHVPPRRDFVKQHDYDDGGEEEEDFHESMRSYLMEEMVETVKTKQYAKSTKKHVMDNILDLLLEDIGAGPETQDTTSQDPQPAVTSADVDDTDRKVAARPIRPTRLRTRRGSSSTNRAAPPKRSSGRGEEQTTSHSNSSNSNSNSNGSQDERKKQATFSTNRRLSRRSNTRKSSHS